MVLHMMQQSEMASERRKQERRISGLSAQSPAVINGRCLEKFRNREL